MTNKEIEKIIKKVQSEADKKNQKYFEKVKTEIKKEFSSQIGVYTENINDRFKATGEGMAGIDQRLSKIEKTLDSHTEQLANILVDSNSVKIDMGRVSYEVTMHLDKKVDKKHFVDLEGRVRVLEKNK